ncbi:hypothetical protein R1sor_020672 [Riccia sorocarpa]|uniref:Uncharacterized protein n=1 Tax=Riccia sorocarpa TaxID=122646 RepID=A0ABD3GGI7_9MARC
MEKSKKAAEELHILVMAEEQMEMVKSDADIGTRGGAAIAFCDYIVHNGGGSDVDSDDDCRCRGFELEDSRPSLILGRYGLDVVSWLVTVRRSEEEANAEAKKKRRTSDALASSSSGLVCYGND